MRGTIEQEMQKYFEKKFAKHLEDGVPVTSLYKIIAKPNELSMDSEIMRDLVMQVRVIFLSGRTAKTVNITQLFLPVNQICVLCKEDKYLNELRYLWAKGTIGISIPDLEKCVSSMKMRFRINNKIISRDKITYSFQQTQQRIYNIFYEVYSRNDIKVPFSMGDIFNSLGQEKGESQYG